MNNRKHNSKNPYQGDAKKVLCVCSAGLLRSPTAANVLNNILGYNTRAAGVSLDHALIPVDEVLLEWADEVVCMEQEHASYLNLAFGYDEATVLNIPDMYSYGDEDLQSMILTHYLKSEGRV